MTLAKFYIEKLRKSQVIDKNFKLIRLIDGLMEDIEFDKERLLSQTSETSGFQDPLIIKELPFYAEGHIMNLAELKDELAYEFNQMDSSLTLVKNKALQRISVEKKNIFSQLIEKPFYIHNEALQKALNKEDSIKNQLDQAINQGNYLFFKNKGFEGAFKPLSFLVDINFLPYQMLKNVQTQKAQALFQANILDESIDNYN